MTTKLTKPHVSEQSCGNCAFSRPRPLGGRVHGTDLECRWDGPPWVERGVLPIDWCRRWGARPPAKREGT